MSTLKGKESDAVKLLTATGRKIEEMAYNRETFKDRIEEKIRGALYEYYKAETAAVNAMTKWVSHWRGEAQRLLKELEEVILPHEIRGFRDRRKALQEVIDYVRLEDDHYRATARHIVARDFKMKKLRREMPAAASESFFRAVEEMKVPS